MNQELEQFKAGIRKKNRERFKVWCDKNREKWREYNRNYSRKKRGILYDKFRVK